MKKIIIKSIIFSWFFTPIIYGQIGINNIDPKASLDVTSTETNQSHIVFNVDIPTNHNGALNIYNNGNITMQQDQSSFVKFDLRNRLTNGESSIGIGYTDLSATEAQAGAIRYNPTYQALEYSDGLNWNRLQTNPTKGFVIANNSSGQRMSNIPSFLAYYESLKNWTSVYDQTNSFNPSNGIFTAPHTGLYSVSATATFDNISVRQGGQYEVIINGNNGGSEFKSVVPYLTAVTSGRISNMAQTILYLTAGQTIEVYVYFNLFDRAPSLYTDASFNTLTIAEM